MAALTYGNCVYGGAISGSVHSDWSSAYSQANTACGTAVAILKFTTPDFNGTSTSMSIALRAYKFPTETQNDCTLRWALCSSDAYKDNYIGAVGAVTSDPYMLSNGTFSLTGLSVSEYKDTVLLAPCKTLQPNTPYYVYFWSETSFAALLSSYQYGLVNYYPAEDTGPWSKYTPYIYDGTVKTYGTVKVDTTLNIRSGPGTGYGRVGYLNNGDRVEILEQTTVDSQVWGRIESGWVCITGNVTLETVQPGWVKYTPRIHNGSEFVEYEVYIIDTADATVDGAEPILGTGILGEMIL